jgi:co-chaperonin GroES (HSP10)
MSEAVKNTSGLRPLGYAVLLEPYQPELSKTLLAVPETVRDSTIMVELRAIVIEAGPEAWKDEGQPRAKPGDKVLITRMAGYLAKGPLDGKRYRVVNDRDVFCGIEEPAGG